MRLIPLNTTIGKIEEANKSYSYPLDIFRIMNLFTPRDWRFKIEFDENNRNHLHIESEPELTDDEMLKALDGRIPSLYGFETLSISINGVIFTHDLSRSSEDALRNTECEFYEDLGEKIDGQIKIIGYPSSSIISQQNKFEEWLRKNTWLGSKRHEEKNITCSVILMANAYLYKPIKKDSGITPIFQNNYSIVYENKFLGELRIDCVSFDYTKNIIRHCECGVFDVSIYEPSFWKKLSLNKHGATILEINSSILNWYTGFGPYNVPGLRNILSGIINLSEGVIPSKEYQEFVGMAETYKKRITAHELKKRQESVRSREMVLINDREAMSIPTCENEVVALYMKLEGSGNLPFECTVLEFTSQRGIDALSRYRIKPTSHFNELAPTEFEFKLDNYFGHGHPIEQTKLIICWDMSEGFDIDEFFEGTNPLTILKDKELEWLYYLQSTDRTIDVVLLSLMPNISVI